MKKEVLDMRTRAVLIFVIMLAIFLSLAPLQNFAVKTLQKYEDQLKGYNVSLLNDWNFYIYSQWFGKNLGQFIPIIAIIFAFPLFSREYENGTMEFLLTRRKRRQVFFDKVIAALIVLCVEIAVFSTLPALYSLVFSKPLDYKLTWGFLIQTEIGGVLWFSVGVIASVLYNDQVKPIIASLGILGLTTAVGFLRPLKFLNTYTYILGMNIFKSQGIDVVRTIVFLLTSAVLIYLSYGIFKNKEI